MNLSDFSPAVQEQIRKQLNEDRRKVTSPVIERTACDALSGKNEAQAQHPRRTLVRVTSFRRRLLDEDNLIPKYHVDGCRYAGLLDSDAPGKTKIETTQVQVATKEEERTEIEILKPL